ncbi:PTS N-acetylglucosamine transporter subunit IIBC [Lactiplantibacillus plantarum]|uniref:PTS sugar transporter subunit IIA n=1 Tax=Lactiplantibacillus plantarum TaxID=1590 RepID=UPI0007BB0AB8|nr:PTS N-acetylglucosamine transporter subunit IIBC [Lactiplantibacillus plantarum]AYE58201.1 PTS N-acetylglucosamine transporter subunit IIBC [Lactiplantibacillus plantarum]KZU54700.1 PTS system mannose-specific IIA component [Lactiplantibacillus plantarum]MCG0574066.1 PTS family mannose/fructose/sorbose porter component IIA [Lactiplantibacillus plantarum]QBJ55882.1 PTS N-acetylglucosamine transporter subunit IIBC [Lactiplantibacillus plantarum]
MKRKIILASHHQFASGLADTVNFISNNAADIVALTAYMDNQPVEQQVKSLMASIPAEVEIVILTDMLAGSVKQQFFNYRMRPHTQIISGMNLPLALAIALEPTDHELTDQRVCDLITQAQESIVSVNQMSIEMDDDE